MHHSWDQNWHFWSFLKISSVDFSEIVSDVLRDLVAFVQFKAYVSYFLSNFCFSTKW